jgi:ATP-dependent DNA helicase RecG
VELTGDIGSLTGHTSSGGVSMNNRSVKQLQLWMNDHEDQHLEFKAATGSYEFDKLADYCTALANEGGGRIILGVTDKRPRRVVGTQAFQELTRTVAGLLDRIRLRVDVEEISHPNGRVLIFHVPSCSIGVPVHHKGRYWMRSGEELVPMSPDRLKRIIDESQPDFSALVCPGAVVEDLNDETIEHFRSLWVRKSGNQKLLSLSREQLLLDSELIISGGVTYAALILLGTKQALGKYLAQAEAVFEYRSSDISGPPAQREEFRQGALKTLDALWHLLNLRNDNQPFQDGLFIFDIPTFNALAVREALLNAFVHRDYRLGGSIFVRQYPRRLEVISPGGFPPGVSAENVLWKQIPRNRRIAEAVARCGLVERSGQGVNRMFEEAIREGKPVPDFVGTDEYEVSLTLHGDVQDVRFLKFLEKIGQERLDSFTTEDFLLIDVVHREHTIDGRLKSRIPHLVDQGVIEAAGDGKYILSRSLYTYLGQKGVYTRRKGLDRETNKALLLKHIADNDSEGSKFSELLQVLPALTRDRVQKMLIELQTEGKAHVQGRTSAARWHYGPPHHP